MNAALSFGSASMVHPPNRTNHQGTGAGSGGRGTRQTQEDGNMTRFTSLLIAAAAVATMVGFATPGQAHDWRQGNRYDWVYNGQASYGFQHGGQWQQFLFGNFGFGWRQHQLGPRQIRWSLRRQGFHRIRHIEDRRGIYRAVAAGRHGLPRQVFARAPAAGRSARPTTTASSARRGRRNGC